MTVACTSSPSFASLNEFRPRRQNWDVWDNQCVLHTGVEFDEGFLVRVGRNRSDSRTFCRPANPIPVNQQILYQ